MGLVGGGGGDRLRSADRGQRAERHLRTRDTRRVDKKQSELEGTLVSHRNYFSVTSHDALGVGGT